MLEWITEDTLRGLEFLLKISAAVGVLYGGYRFLRPRLKPYLAGLATLAELPAIASGMLDMQGTMAGMDQRLARVHQEVLPNHGSSLRDAVGRTEVAMGEIRRDVARVNGVNRALADVDHRRALFESDPAGRCTEVNRTYLRWVNRSASELLGWGWITSIAKADRPRVRSEWAAALNEQREFDLDYRMVDTAGGEFPVRCIARPITGVSGAVELFVGTIIRLDENDA